MSLVLRDAPLRSQLVLDADRDDPGTRQRLAALGLRDGVAFQLMQKTAGGGRVARLGQSRVAIGAELSSSLHVKVIK